MSLEISAIADSIRTTGMVEFLMAGKKISINLQNRHERAYAAKLLLNVHCPQSDIDSFLFKRFVSRGDTVLDAGANIGFTALECLDAGAVHVVAVEPLPALYSRLMQMADDRLTVIGKGISAKVGTADFFVSKLHNQGSSLKTEILGLFPAIFGEHPEKIRIGLTTIDAISSVFGPSDVWKVDVEGAEIDALLGASRTLAEHPPRAILVELYDDYFSGFMEVARRTHRFAYRAVIREDTYALELREAHPGPQKGVYQTSPMYVFLRDPL